MRRGAIALILLLAAIALAMRAEPARAAGDRELVLTRGEVPGLRPAGGGARVAREALGRDRALPPPLRRARAQGAAFRGAGRALRAGAFVLRSPRAARTALRRSARGLRPLRAAAIGDEARAGTRLTRRTAEAVVLLRAGRALGAVRLTVARRDARLAAPAAQAYAATLAVRLERALTRTAWQRTLDGIRPDGSITPGLALRAFAIAYGPLPGVRRAGGRLGVPESGTLAMHLVARVWARLTPAQRGAIDRALGAPHDAASPVRARAAADDPPLTPSPRFQAVADRYAAIYAGRLPGTPPVAIRVFTTTEEITTKDGGKVWADALPVNAAGQWGVGDAAYCRVRIPPFGQAQSGRPFFQLIMAHEVFHCFQFRLMANWRHRPDWLMEGMADWAATSVVSTTAAVGAAPYRAYLLGLGTSLLKRTYDATGFWHWADELGGVGSLWPRVPAILAAPDDQASFALAGGTAPSFVESWASAAARVPGAGRLWNQSRPYALTYVAQPNPIVAIASDARLNADPFTTVVHGVAANARQPLVSVRTLAGAMRAGARGSDLGVVGEHAWYCLGGRCECPAGQEGEVPPHRDVRTRLTLALTGGREEAGGTVSYHRVEEFCRRRERPSRPRGPGETNGDPHLTSLDGLHFDFQAAGEFILARSPRRDLEIQARQEPYGRSRTVTVNTQIAMRVGGRRVTTSPGAAPADPPQVRIDGKPTPLPAGSSVALGAGTVAREADGGDVTVQWRDGSTVTVRAVGRWGVSARVQLAPGRANRVAGLLGDFDGSPGNDLADRRGRRIAYRSRVSAGWTDVLRYDVREEYAGRFFDLLYDDVGDSWRVRQRESLLDYGPGQTTRTFTDKRIPTKPVDPEEIARARRAAAERVCREHGVTQPGPLADCIVDVAATGNPAFAEDAAEAQQAGSVAWTALRAGRGLAGGLSLARTSDGTLHVGFRDRAGGAAGLATSVPVDARGREGAPEVISALDTQPVLFTGPDGGLRAALAELSQDRSGAYQYARSATGTWSALGPITTVGYAYAASPQALALPDGTLISVSPMAGVAQLFRGAAPGNPGVPLDSQAPGCYSTSPALARDGATGAVWVAWLQWDCPQLGVYVQQVDAATGTLLGAPLRAPGSTWTSEGVARYPDVLLDETLAFSGRPGRAGVLLAYPAGAAGDVSVWRVGDATASVLRHRRERAGRVRIAAAPRGGRAWVGWQEDRRLWLQRLSPAGAPEGAPRPLDPARAAAGLSMLHDVGLSAGAGGLDVVYGVRRGDKPGGLWLARIMP
jgi:hypothetical protein